MTDHEAVRYDEDFIFNRRFGNSVERLLSRYPDGVPDRMIGVALDLTDAEVEQMYQRIVAKLRARIGVE